MPHIHTLPFSVSIFQAVRSPPAAIWYRPSELRPNCASVSSAVATTTSIAIATGTPGGVGYARTPPVFMEPGDLAECSVEGIGTLTNPVMRWEDVMPR